MYFRWDNENGNIPYIIYFHPLNTLVAQSHQQKVTVFTKDCKRKEKKEKPTRNLLNITQNSKKVFLSESAVNRFNIYDV